MLQSIHVKNLALIEETEVNFEKGLNVITGETGAGKSLLIGSVSLAIGGKFDASMLRKGTDSGFVELVFGTSDERVADKLKSYDIDFEDGLVILTRKLSAGKSTCKVNGETVTMKQLQDIAEELIDIHGQHEHQSLLKKSKHLEIVDAYGEQEIAPVMKEIKAAYNAWKELKAELESSQMSDESAQREKALLEFQCNEISAAGLTAGEDDELEDRYRIMSNARKILEALGETYSCTGSENDTGIASMLGEAMRSIGSVSCYDKRLEGLEVQLSDIEALMNDFNRELSSYLSDYEFEDEEFAQVTERLDMINDLKRKYGKTVEDILDFYNESKEQLAKLENYDRYMEELKIKERTAYDSLIKLCEKASKLRKKLAASLSEKLKEALINLNFLTVEFEIVLRSLDEPTAKGMDEAEFMISTNPGESLRPMVEIASGGELSRIMLGIKTVLAGKDHIDTLIFDEIDTGISGKTAWKVSTQLGLLGREHQVLCITHLPQIAAMADAHFVIEKSAENGSTKTNVRSIVDNESINELARLLGSDESSAAAVQNAIDMKQKANDYKKSCSVL